MITVLVKKNLLAQVCKHTWRNSCEIEAWKVWARERERANTFVTHVWKLPTVRIYRVCTSRMARCTVYKVYRNKFIPMKQQSQSKRVQWTSISFFLHCRLLSCNWRNPLFFSINWQEYFFFAFYRPWRVFCAHITGKRSQLFMGQLSALLFPSLRVLQ